jgi:hypothetical protein
MSNGTTTVTAKLNVQGPNLQAFTISVMGQPTTDTTTYYREPRPGDVVPELSKIEQVIEYLKVLYK